MLNVSVLPLHGDTSEREMAKSMLVPPPDMTLEEAQSHLSALGVLDFDARAHFVGLIGALLGVQANSPSLRPPLNPQLKALRVTA